MAVLNKIRQKSVFLIIIIALALFSFVLADVIRNGGFSSNKSVSTIATVNGTDIPRQEFMEQVQARQQNIGGNASQAMNLVWEQELRRVLLGQQFEALGMTVGQDKLDDALSINLADNPTFQDETGLFSLARLNEYVASIRGNKQMADQWDTYIENTKKSILQETYLNMVRGGLVSTLADGEQQYRFENDKVNIEYAYIPYSKIADEDVTVSDADIEAYVRAHASDFEVNPQVDIQYVVFDETPSLEDEKETEKEVSLLLADKIEYNTTTKSNDTIPGFRNTKDNASFVAEHSSLPYSDRWLYKSDLPKEIVDQVFDLNENEIYGPYKAKDTYSLSKVMAVGQLPDTVTARHILIPIGLNPTDSITRTEEQAKATADSILKVIKRSPSQFASIVAAMSSDTGSIENDGRYESFAYQTMVPEFRDFCFESKKGDMGVVQTRFGFHIIEVEDQKNIQRVIKVATVTQSIEASEKTRNDVFAAATGFEVESQKADFAALTKEKGYSLMPVNKIGEMDSNIPGIGANRSIVVWAFNEDNAVGTIKRFNTPNGYVVAQITRKSPKGLMSVAEATALVSPKIRKEKKAEVIRASISGTTVQEVAGSQSVAVKNATALTMASPTIAGAGTEPAVVGAAFGLSAGEETGLINGENGVFKVKVLAVNAAPDLANYASYANQLTSQATPQVNTGVYNALKNNAEIEDNRASNF